MKSSQALSLLLGVAYVVLMALGAVAPDNEQGPHFVTAVLFWCCGMFEATADEARRRRQDPAPYWRQA